MESRGNNDPGLIRLENGRASSEADLRGEGRPHWLQGSPSTAYSSLGIHPAVAERLSEAQLMGGEARQERTNGRRITGFLALGATVTAVLATALLSVQALFASTPATHHPQAITAVGKSVRSVGSSTVAQTPVAVVSPSADSNGIATSGDPSATDPSTTGPSSSDNGTATGGGPASSDPTGNVIPDPTAQPTIAPTPVPTPRPTPVPTPTPVQQISETHTGGLVAAEQTSYCNGASGSSSWSCTYTIHTTAPGPIGVSFTPNPSATACVASIRNASNQQITGIGNGGSGSFTGSTPSQPAGTYLIVFADWSQTNAFFSATLTHY